VVKIARTDRDRRLREEALEALTDSDDPRAHQALRMSGEQ